MGPFCFLWAMVDIRTVRFCVQSFALCFFLSILPLTVSVQQKAVTHRVCNGFLPGQNTTRRILNELYN